MYRTAAAPVVPDAVVFCRGCATSRPVALEAERHDTFACASCKQEQPVLRGDEDLVVQDLVYVSLERAKYNELTHFLGTLGVADAKASQVTVRCDGMNALVSVSLNSGSVDGADMAVPVAGLPLMTLLRETDAHREAEAKGVVREVQAGDPSFDADVFIESEASDADVKVVLSSPGVRKAIAHLLLMGAAWVRIERDFVKIFVALDKDPFDSRRIRDRLGCLRTIAGAPRPLVHEKVEMPPLAKLVNGASYALPLTSIAGVIISGINYTPMEARPWIVGIIAGLVIAAVLQPLVTYALRGRSTSLTEIGRTRIITFVGLPILVTALLIFVNGAFDRSRARRVEMPVTSSSVDSDDSSKVNVTATDEIGESHTFSFAAPVAEKTAKVIIHVRPGALGWRWQTDSAVLVR